MFSIIQKYVTWLHTQWPDGRVERLPTVQEDGSTNVPGLYVAGDLTGIPLLKFSAHTGARAVQRIADDPVFRRRDTRAERDGRSVLDLVIVGGGVSGMAAALEAHTRGINFRIVEASEAFSTLVNFPKGKPIFTYPVDMVPAGELQFSQKADVKERLLDDLRARTLEKGIQPIIARVERVMRKGDVLEVVIPDGENLVSYRVIVGIGRSGSFRKLGIPGEDLDKVYNRLHDPKDFCDQDVLVVGGGDSALETAIAIADCGGRVTLSYRRPAFNRPKPENVERLNALKTHAEADGEPGSEREAPLAGMAAGEKRKRGYIRLMMASQPREIRARKVVVTLSDGKEETLSNDAVFAMIGRDPPLDFFRRSGVSIRGEWRPSTWLSFAIVLLAAVFVYHWKTSAGIPIYNWFKGADLFPFNMGAPADASSLWGTLRISMGQPSFHYSLAYCLAVVGFGYRRVQRRKTPYVKAQTIVLALIQCVPLFLLPYVALPWMGHNGWFSEGSVLKPVADALFPASEWAEHGREYWRTLGLVLAWPLFVWNVFTHQPMWTWLGISLVQTFVVIPWIVRRWGKGAYCGWICSCGALAETMGDAHRHKMPHGPVWNRVNMVGQAILGIALLLLALRVVGWMLPYDHWTHAVYMGIFMGKDVNWGNLPFPLTFFNYVWSVDLLLAGIIGVGFYWHFSGRVWCRFACPLAALMHIYARFSQFRILADKKKCISCTVCTSVCHQGIDVMNFANKGLPMEDPECVRCSACVQSCPTGVLTFGRVDPKTGEVAGTDHLAASPVQMQETARA